MALDLTKTSADWLVCDCGNEPHIDGFYPCLPDGTDVEPDDKRWSGWTYVCDRCDVIYSADTCKQVGKKDKA